MSAVGRLDPFGERAFRAPLIFYTAHSGCAGSVQQLFAALRSLAPPGMTSTVRRCAGPILGSAVSVTPSMDGEGNLILKIEDVEFHGTIMNPANDRVVEIQWARQRGPVGFEFGDGSANVLLELTGNMSRGSTRAIRI